MLTSLSEGDRMKLSLSELKKLYETEGRRPFAVKVDGHVDLVVRNADGTVDQAVSKPNLATSLWNDRWSYGGVNLRNMYLCILPDDNGDMDPYKTAGRHLYPNNYEVAVTASVNSSTSTWTYTGVLGTPSADRTFRYVGLRHNAAAVTDSTARAASFIYAMTRMTTNISQTTSQTLEVVYRVSFSRV